MEARQPTCSVLMRTRNSAPVVAQALQALFSQTFRDFELVVVDSGSTDATLAIASRFPHRLLRREAQDYFPGRVLNEAVPETRGRIVVFLNSDCVLLGPGALGRLVEALETPDVTGEPVMAAFARQVPRPDAWTHVRAEYARAFPASGEAPPWLPLSLPFAAIRREALLEQPFYTQAWGSEDTEWGVQARRRGWRARYVPEVLVMHSHNYALGALYGRRFIEGEADAFILGTRDSLFAAARRVVGRTARDVAGALRARDLRDLALAPIRRTVEAAAYCRGNRLGCRRRARGDADAREGQRIALSRHESSR